MEQTVQREVKQESHNYAFHYGIEDRDAQVPACGNYKAYLAALFVFV